MQRDTYLEDYNWQLAVCLKFFDPLYKRWGFEAKRYPRDHPMQVRHVDVLLRKLPFIFALPLDEKIYTGRRDGFPPTKLIWEILNSTVPRETLGWGHKDEPNDCENLLVGITDIDKKAQLAGAPVKRLDCLWIPFVPAREWIWSQPATRWGKPLYNGGRKQSMSWEVPIREIVRAVPGIERYKLRD